MTTDEAIEWLKMYEVDSVKFEKAIQEAISALEKQIRKKPIHNDAIKEWECPNCHSYFARENDRPRHCCECGQEIDWEESRDYDYRGMQETQKGIPADARQS